jgi:hypothetical protein
VREAAAFNRANLNALIVYRFTSPLTLHETRNPASGLRNQTRLSS